MMWTEWTGWTKWTPPNFKSLNLPFPYFTNALLPYRISTLCLCASVPLCLLLSPQGPDGGGHSFFGAEDAGAGD